MNNDDIEHRYHLFDFVRQDSLRVGSKRCQRAGRIAVLLIASLCLCLAILCAAAENDRALVTESDEGKSATIVSLSRSPRGDNGIARMRTPASPTAKAKTRFVSITGEGADRSSYSAMTLNGAMSSKVGNDALMDLELGHLKDIDMNAEDQQEDALAAMDALNNDFGARPIGDTVAKLERERAGFGKPMNFHEFYKRPAASPKRALPDSDEEMHFMKSPKSASKTPRSADGRKMRASDLMYDKLRRLKRLDDEENSWSRWCCTPKNRLSIWIRAEPDINGTKTKELMNVNEMFTVSEEYFNEEENVTYLRLADGRGWVFDTKPGIGTMCERAGIPPTTTERPKPRFSGKWNYGRFVSRDCTTVTWRDGTTSQIKVDGWKIELFLKGESFHGFLAGDTINWSDGDQWVRYEDSSDEEAMEDDTPENSPLGKVIARCDEIEDIQLANLQIGNVGVETLAQVLPGCPNVKWLHLEKNGITAAGASALAQALPNCTNLKWLHLDGNELKLQGIEALAEALPQMSSLKSLHLDGTVLANDGVKALARVLPGCTKLDWLYLKDNDIGAEGAVALAEALPHLKTLKGLDMDNNTIGDIGAEALAKVFPGCNALDHIHFNTNGIGLQGATALGDALPGCKALEHLYLSCNMIGDEGVVGLAKGLPGCQTLRSLYLRGNAIGDAGAIALADELPEWDESAQCMRQALGMPNVFLYLNLNDNEIGDAGAHALAESLTKCSNLKWLHLDTNRIGDNGAEELADALTGCRSLKELHLRENKITDLGGEAFADVLPKTSLEWLFLDDHEMSAPINHQLTATGKVSFEFVTPALAGSLPFAASFHDTPMKTLGSPRSPEFDYPPIEYLGLNTPVKFKRRTLRQIRSSWNRKTYGTPEKSPMTAKVQSPFKSPRKRTPGSGRTPQKPHRAVYKPRGLPRNPQGSLRPVAPPEPVKPANVAWWR